VLLDPFSKEIGGPSTTTGWHTPGGYYEVSNPGPRRWGEARGEPRRGGVTSRAGKGDPRRDRWTRGSARGRGIRGATDGRGGPLGKGGSAARPMDEGVHAGKGDPRCDRWTSGSGRRRGIRGKKTLVGKGQRYAWKKDSATYGKRIALSARRGQCDKDGINVRQG